MIIEVNPNKKNKICSPVIGFEAENKVTGFEFDYSDWAADIGDGYLTLSVKRPTDTIPYPVSLTQTGTHKATWTVSSTDVAFAGRGEVQLTYIVDDKVKKSAIYEILIDRSLEPDGDIPDPYISWFEELLQVSVQVEADADRAEAAADSIKNLEAVAVTLPSGESATAEYDPETGVMSFGIPKGDKGDTGDVGPTGNGISSTVLNADYTLTINFTDGTSYTTPSIRGEQGIQGEIGETGNGIASTVLNPDYTLTITFTDGTTYTTPSIRGPEGAQGQTGPTGNGIDNVTMDASGYLTITFTDGSTWTSPTSLFGPVQDVKVNGESVVDENGVANITVPIITKTVSGNPIVVDDADGAVQALKVSLLPIQEGSGTPSPQNIRPITGRTQTEITDRGGDTQSHTTTVTLPHTVYGADVDVTGGESKETWEPKTLNGSETGWTFIAKSDPTHSYAYNRNATLGDLLTATAILSSYVESNVFAADNDVQGIYVDSGYLWIRTSAMQNMTTSGEWTAYLANNPLQTVYELATPTDLQTTPTDVKLFKGDNVVSADGTMTLTYVRNLQMVIDKIESAL